jgi:HemK-like putative methylase
MNKDIPRVLAHLDDEISDKDLSWIQTSYHSYAVEKQPLEYILGYVEFLGNRFMVDRNTLIPRPETEYMIQAVVKELEKSRNSQFVIRNSLIDVGTGCGVLGLSCALHAGEYIDQLYLTEYYPETLEVARRNLEKYKVESKKSKDQSDNQQSEILHHIQLLNCSLLDHPLLQEKIKQTISPLVKDGTPQGEI